MNEQNETKNTEEKEKKPVNWKSEIISWIQILVAAAAIAFVLNTFIIANSRVPSASMENTIMAGSRVIGSGKALVYCLILGDLTSYGDLESFCGNRKRGFSDLK